MIPHLRQLSCLAVLLCAGCTGVSPALRPQAAPAKPGSADSQYAQGIRLLVREDDGRLNSPEQAYPWLLSAAQQGHVNAQAMVGLCLQKGWGVADDEAAAAAWFAKAAAQGHSRAAMLLAEIFIARGQQAQATACLARALSKGRGTPEAHAMLASLYSARGATRKAVRHLRFAALDGHAESAYLMAQHYKSGIGVPQDENLMRGWLQNAADLGYAPAKQQLADLPQQN